MSYWIISIGALILLSSTLFFWAAFSSKLVVSLSNDGIWTYVHSKWIPWYDVESITINDGMLVVAISDVEKHFPESSAFTKNLLKRTVIDLARTDVNKMELFDLIDSKFTGSQLK
ncbi:MAG TPA: hypothetical protein PKA82_09865 [Pyrinomonadaceae bacterium]|nr:hypothetical protein [Pyrinomonadaceae bacterium]